ncbi:CBS domain-containing protein [Comamonas aquatica]|jgi:CBS domain-containing protein|uniref:CBS domain-containing protein n=1 Tax=Comamonas aquatica TaxID=225991 RepID=A0A1B2D2A2_9BURK|nr:MULTISPECIES: CBS domain-containing protein [Comamonas]ANY61825.1 histidine kinase [Comamonas aquatica]MDE1555906.1 CBS domain-containing protein [Comamonas aquatica]MDH0200956.1 CBS domain-containing protein [Comamonas aquatica]MDH0362318.1 CBS domain-containing protein [Comamonas aquatica]MDH0373364.1 CBS domain-containing protein [Comamonas aquatica]
MFYVFGIHGPMYQGGPDRLSQIAAVRGVQRPSGLRASSSGIESQEAQARNPDLLHHLTARAQGAVSAYLGTEQGPKEERKRLYLVRDVMTRGAVTVTPELTVEQAWQVLASKKIAQAPVLDAQQRVVGLLLRADMAPLALLPEPGALRDAIALAKRPVTEAMLSPVPAVAEDTDLRRVAHVLLDTGLPGLPVTDDLGHLSGFISRTDILRAVASDPPLDLWG